MPTLSSAKFSEAKSGWKINVFSGPSNCTCQLHAETAAPKQHQATKICKELNSWPVGSKMLQNVVSPQKNALVYKCKLWHLLLPNAEKSTAEVCSNLDARILNWSWKSKDYIALFGNWMYPEMALNKQCSRASVVPFSWLVNSDSHSGQLMTLHNICTIYIIYNTHAIIYVYMYICIYVYMCICIYVYMYICIYVYMYIYIYVICRVVYPSIIMNQRQFGTLLEWHFQGGKCGWTRCAMAKTYGIWDMVILISFGNLYIWNKKH